MAAKKKLSSLPGPIACVVLAVDTAEHSGWSIWSSGVLLWSGEHSMLKEHMRAEQICRMARDAAKIAGIKSVLVLEKPFSGSNQGQYIGAWKVAWYVAHGGMNVPPSVGMYPNQWRARCRLPVGKARDDVRFAEVRFAGQFTSTSRDVGDDEAAAICLGYAATRAPEVLKIISNTKKGKVAT